MEYRILFIAAICALLNGCGQTQGSAKASTPRAKPCQAADTVAADRCSNQAGMRICRLVVIDSGNGPVVYPYKLRVPSHGPNRNVRIVWELLTQHMAFDKNRGDGPLELLNDARFSNASPATDPDGAASAAKGKYYRIDFKNDASTGSSGINYELQFGPESGAGKISCDPSITNEAG